MAAAKGNPNSGDDHLHLVMLGAAGRALAIFQILPKSDKDRGA